MSVRDVQRDPGAAWVLPAYHQYRLSLCYQVTIETSSPPTSDRWPLHSLSRKTLHCNKLTIKSMGSDERCFFCIRGVHGDLVIS